MIHFKKASRLVDKDRFFYRNYVLILFIILPWALFAQTRQVSLSVRDVSIKELLLEIERKTDVRFSYKDADVDGNKNVTLSVKNQSVDDILKQVLSKRGLSYSVTGNTVSIVKNVKKGQRERKKKVVGVVVDQTDTPVIGANITENGTTNGTITDLDGKFTLEVEENAVLLISYIGYLTEKVSASGKQSFQIKLTEDAQTLNEVVVVGYGVQKKKLVTGATVQVKGDEIQKLNTVSPVGALQSQSPGVTIVKSSGQPGSDFKVNIRGVGTTGDSAPLYIVDGVPVGSIDYLSPSDIESIDVLKDAASAAIYGARAANGVILVTTKQGKSGKPTIEYEGFLGIQNMIQKVKPLNAQEYVMIMKEAGENAGMNPFDFAALVPNWEAIENGSWNGTNWINEMKNKNAAMQNHALSIRGGTDQSVYSLGLSYTEQDGAFGKPAVPTFTRYTALVNTDHKLIKNAKWDILKVGENLNYTYTERNTIGIGNLYANDIRTALSTNPLMPVYNEKGEYHYALDWDDKQVNPMGLLYNTRANNLTRTHQLVGNMYLELQPIKGLKFRSSFGVNMHTNSYRSFTPIYDLGPQDFTVENKAIQQQSTFFKWMFENTLSYDLKIKDVHSFSFLLGTSAEKSGIGESLRGENVNLIFDDFEHAYLSNAKSIYEGKTILRGQPQTPGRLLSYFGRLNYNLKETYMASLVMRADGSSNFSPNHRWGYFPSVSVGWVVSNEAFMKKSANWLDFLKLRLSWGQNGNQNITGFQYLANIAFDSKYFFGTDKNNGATGAYPSILANPNVKWETSEQLNVGVDARFFNGRLNVALDWYNKDTKDWLLVAPVLGSFGTGAPYVNGGDVRNRGFELGLNWRDQLGEFKYGANFNLAYNKNEVTRIANSEGIIHGPANVLSHNTAELYRAQVGFPIGYFWGYETNGVFQNESEIQAYKNSKGELILPNAKPGDLIFVDKNDDALIDDNDKVMIGDPNPDFTFGISFNFAYKGFDLSMVTNGVMGNQIARAYRSANLPYQNYTTEILGRWHGEGTSNRTPRVVASGHINDLYVSDRYIENGDYWRISNITLGYDFKRLFGKLPLQQVRLYITGQNLATLTGYKGLDPEVGYGYDSSWASGIDLGFYPSPRVFMVGLSVKY